MKSRDRGMKVAIAGAGMTGAYLFRLLKDEGCDVHIFDMKQRTRCGLKPCAWGTSLGFVELVMHAGLDAEKYIVRRLDHVWMDGLRINADLMIFDKPRLVRDLLNNADVCFTPVPMGVYDRIIDATGVARALLPPIDDDIVMECRQYFMETEELLENRIKLGGIGYAWCFPLSGYSYHIGCGSLLKNPQHVLRDLGWIEGTAPPHEKRIRCNCAGKIRLTGPWYSRPFVAHRSGEEVWGIGEAIGCVAPLAGDGVVPGMRCVQVLLDNWDKPLEYEKALLREFRWMKDERSVIDKLRKSEGIGIREANILRKNSKRMGMQVGLRDAVALLNNLG